MANLSGRDYLELIKLLRIDLFLMLSVIGSGIPSVTINQLAQDKFCLNSLSVNETVCLNLENAGAEYDSIRDEVLERATTFKMYTTIITTLPSIFTSLFLGYWIDTYPNHLRYILVLGPKAMIVQNLLLIYHSINFQTEAMSLLYTYIGPSMTSSLVTTGAYTYATRKTPAKYRAIRFTVLEVFVIAAMPMSSAIGGILLGAKPWFPGQHRNYIGVFIGSAVFSTISVIWCLFMVRDSYYQDASKNETDDVSESRDIEGNSPGIQRSDSMEQNLVESPKEKSLREMMMDIFKVRNLINTLRTAFKPRINNQRAALLAIMMSSVICNIGYMGEQTIGLQFAQKVYHWTSEYYSYMAAIFIIIPAVVTISTPAILIHKYNQHDTVLGVMGCVSLELFLFLRGIFLNKAIFFVAAISGSFVGLLPITNRSIISRLITGNEVGQIYSILASIEPAGPLLSSVLYSNIFNATIDTYPGTVYIVIGLICSFPAVVTIWLFFTRYQWDLNLIQGTVKSAHPINVHSTLENKNSDERNDMIVQAAYDSGLDDVDSRRQV